MAERIDFGSDRPQRHRSAPRLPARSEMNYRDGRPDLELYDVLEALHEGSDEPDDGSGLSRGSPAGHHAAGRQG